MDSYRNQQHNFKRCTDGKGCSFCNDLWPPVDGLVSKFQFCESCGLVVHTSCKLLGNRCIPCNNKSSSSREFVLDRKIKGQLHLKLRQAFDMGGSAGNLLYGVWKYSSQPFIRTGTSTANTNDCVWEESIENTIEIPVDFSSDVSVELKLEIWNSYFEIFDKKLFSSSISILPAIKYSNFLLERWFTLHNLLTGHIGKVLVEISFISNATLELEKMQNELNAAFDLVLKEEQAEKEKEKEASLIAQSSTTSGDMSPFEDRMDHDVPHQEQSLSQIEQSSLNESPPIHIREEIEYGDSADVERLCANCTVGTLIPSSPILDHNRDSPLVELSNKSIYSGSLHTGDESGIEKSLTVNIQTNKVEETAAEQLPPTITSDQSNTASLKEDFATKTLASSSIAAETPEKIPQRRLSKQTSASTSINHTITSTPITTDVSFGVPDQQEVSTVDFMMETPFVSLDLVKSSTQRTVNTVSTTPSVKKNVAKPSPSSSSSTSSSLTSKSISKSASSDLVGQLLPPLALSENLFSAVHEDVHRVIKSNSVVSNASDADGEETLLKQLEQGVNNVMQRCTTIWQGHNILPHPSSLSLSLSSPELKHVVDKNNESMSGAFIGLMHIHLHDVIQFVVTKGTSSSSGGEGGEFYCGISVDGREVYFSTPVAKAHAVVASSSSSSSSTSSCSAISHNNPKFDCKFCIGVPHFRSNVHIMLIESRSKRKVGFTKFTPLEVIQREADHKINPSLYPSFQYLSMKDKHGKEELGQFHVNLHFEENMDDYFWSPTVKTAPSGLEEDMSMERFSIHIARFSTIIDLLSGIYSDYLRIMDWSDPIYTATLFLIFLYCTLRVPAEYGLSGLMFFLVLVMTKAGMRRKYGAFKQYYVSKGKKDPSLEYVPLGKVRVSLLAFKHPHRSSSTTSTDELTKNPPVKVTYVAMKEKDQNSTGNGSDGTDRQISLKEYLIGYIGDSPLGGGVETSTNNPTVPNFVSAFVTNREQNRRDGLIQNVYDPWPIDLSKYPTAMEKGSRLVRTRDICLVYPILQPLSNKVDRRCSQGTRFRSPSEVGNISALDEAHSDSSAHSNISAGTTGIGTTTTSNTSFIDRNGDIFLPWSENTSAIKLSLLNERGEESESITISLRDIVNTGNPNNPDLKKCDAYELVRWFEARPTHPQYADSAAAALILNDMDGFLYDDFQANQPSDAGSFPSSSKGHHYKKRTEVLVRINLEIPDERKAFAPNEEEKKMSFVLQQALSDHKAKETSTLAVLWNMRDHVRYVQNVMNNILDWIESFKNLFNWTSPAKTLPIYLSVIAVWLLTVFVSGRILVLLWGLYQFFYIFLPIPDGNEYVIRFQNIVNSLPNDDDLEQIYANERKVFFEAQEKQKKKEFRECLLTSTLPIIWCGNVQIKTNCGNAMAQSSSGSEWSSVYLIIQGKRILWWKSASEAEEGKFSPLGQMILTGFAGITQVSPLDLRMFNEPSKLTAIFGQDFSGHPVKVSLYFDDVKEKLFVESIIHKIAI